MSNPNGNGNEGTESKTGADQRFPARRGSKVVPSTVGSEAAPERLGKGINMSSLCQTLARVLVNLNEGEYTGNVRQDTVLEHDVSPDQASDSGTREAS